MDVPFALSEIVGARHVVAGEQLSGRLENYWSSAETEALALVRPGTTDEASSVLAWCNSHRVPVVPEGGRTNLVHGTRADARSILLSLSRLDDIGVPDADGMCVEAGAGVILETLQSRCAAEGLRFGLDFGARGSATLGGALAMNAGGLQALRYGVARDQVLGLECVLADGTVLSHLVPYRKDNTGYDLKQLFIGSEGTLGVITRASLKLHPLPNSSSTVLMAFADFTAVMRTLARLRQDMRGDLSSFEVMWSSFFEFNVAAICGARRPIEGRYPLYGLCEVERSGSEDDGAFFESVIVALIEAGDVADAALAQSTSQRAEMWRIREDFEVRRGLYAVPVGFDVSLDLRSMQAFVSGLEARLHALDFGIGGFDVYGHVGDGNLHLTIGTSSDSEADRVKDVVYHMTAEYRGSISAEHGIGMAKREHLPQSRSAAEISVMRLLKQALDPNRILNPGKVI